MKIIPKIAVLLTALVLAASISSCTGGKPAAELIVSPEGSGVSDSGIADIALPEVTAVSRLTQDDILEYLKTTYDNPEIKILNATEVGDNLLLIENNLIGYRNFVLCHLDTGEYELIGGYDLALKKVVSENYFIFERKGEFEEGAFYPFPYIVRCFRVSTEDGDNGSFAEIMEDECFALSRSVHAGSKESDKLDSIAVTMSGCELLFKAADGEAGKLFYVAASYIPSTTTFLDERTNEFVIQLDKCTLSEDIQYGTDIAPADNAYIASYRVEKEGESILLRISFKVTPAGYMIRTGKVPDGDEPDGFPYISVSFVNQDYLNDKQAW